MTLIAYGTMVNEALEAAGMLDRQGISAQVVKLNSIVPLDMETVARCAGQTGRVLVAEECVDAGCVGRRIAAELMLRGQTGIRIRLANLGNQFVQHGTVAQLRALCGIDARSLCRKATEVMSDG